MGKLRALALGTAILGSLSSTAAWVDGSSAGDVKALGAQYGGRFLNAEPWVGVDATTAMQTRNASDARVAQLLQNAEYAAAAKARPLPKTYRVRSYTGANVRKYTVKPEWLSQINLEEPREVVQVRVARNAERLVETPLSSLLVGALKTLPGETGKAGFQTRDLRERVEFAKRELAKLAPEEVRSRFQGARYGLEGDAWGAPDVIELLDAAEALSRGLLLDTLTLLAGESKQAVAFDDEADLLKRLGAFFETQLDARSQKLVAQECRQWIEPLFAFQEVETRKTQREVIVRELYPDAAYWRGAISGDCSTTNSAFYVYSPYERNYLIERDGRPLAHTSGTLVRLGTRTAFYLHDMKGNQAKEADYELVLLAMIDHPEVFGADEVVVLTQAKNNQIHWGTARIAEVRGKETAIQYFGPDLFFRRHLGAHQWVASVGYDGPEYNTTAHQIVQNLPRWGLGQTEWIDLAAAAEEKKAPAPVDLQSPAARTRHLHLLSTGTQPLGIDPQERAHLQAAALVLRNPQHLPLAEYYAGVTIALETLQLNLSKRFFETNWPLFREGHLAAPDAFTVEDPTLARRSFEILYNLLYADTPAAGALLAGPARAWSESPKITAELAKFLSARGAQGLARIRQLYQAGVRVGTLLVHDEPTLHAMLATGEPALMHESLRIYRDLGHQFNFDATAWERLVRLLDNEKAEDEEWGRYAAELLALAEQLPTTPTIHKELRRTVKYEETPEILSLASFAYVRFFRDAEVAAEDKKSYGKAAKALLTHPRPEIIPVALWDSVLAELDRTRLPVEQEREEVVVEGQAPDPDRRRVPGQAPRGVLLPGGAFIPCAQAIGRQPAPRDQR